jgi:predicted AAA+ superfamily ATPase
VAVLQGREFRAGTPELGEAFETYLMHELKSFSDYLSGEPLSYWRSTSGFEVDFIIGEHTALEAKAKRNLSPNDIKSLRMLAEERKLKRYICVSMEPRRRKVGNIDILPYKEFLDLLWGEAYT